jgi:hypothetical protein
MNSKIGLTLVVLASVLFFACGGEIGAVSDYGKLQNSEVKEHLNKSAQTARVLAELTGTAVNPLLVTAAIGSYRHYTTPPAKRGELPWFYSFWFLAICVALVSLSFIVSLPAIVANVPPFVSTFIELCNKKLGFILTTPIILDKVTTIAMQLAGKEPPVMVANGAYAYASVIPAEWLASVPPTVWFITIVPALLFTFFAIWLLNYVFDTLILMSPFGWLDLGLKLARGAFYALLFALTIFFPQLAIALTLIVAVISILMLRWSIRKAVAALAALKKGYAGIRGFLKR